MSAWGTGPFQNDDAADWVGDVLEADDAELVRLALDELAERDDGEHVEPPEVSVALAAAEVVAAARGHARAGLAPELAAFAGRHAQALGGLVALAGRAVERVRGTAPHREGAAARVFVRTLDELATRLR